MPPTELAIQEHPPPASIVEHDKLAAIQLAKAVHDLGLSQQIQGRQYLKAEAWSFAARILSLGVETDDPKPFTDTNNQPGYACRARVLDSDGRVLASASAICTRWEKRWTTADDFAIYSMSQTRAVGKAFRIALGALAQLAGFEPVSVEELDEHEVVREESKPGQAATTRAKASKAELAAVAAAGAGLTTTEARRIVVATSDNPKLIYSDQVADIIAALESAPREVLADPVGETLIDADFDDLPTDE